MPDGSELLARTPVTVVLAGRRFPVPYRPAAEWLLNLKHLPGLASRLADGPVRDLMVDTVMRRAGAASDLRAESLRILADATGRKWWEAGRLMSTSLGPELLGRLLLAGVDPWQRSVGEWCAATYALCVKGREEKERLKFDFSLSVPPVGHEDEWDDEGDDEAKIMATVRALGGA